jgi:chromosome segregation protein
VAAAEAAQEQAVVALGEARRALERAEQARAAVQRQAAAKNAAARRQAEELRAAAAEGARALRERARKEAEQRRREATLAAAGQREQARTAAAARTLAARETVAAAHAEAAAAAAAVARLAAEVRTLEALLAAGREGRWSRLVDRLQVPPGLEAALGAALGEALDAATEVAAPRHWRLLPPLPAEPALPAEVTPLAGLLQAPEELARALAHVGLTTDGAAAQKDLAPGQVLVSREGAVWRWDGFVSAAGQPSPAALRLQQRNRLAELRTLLAAATATAATAREAEAAAVAEERRLGALVEAEEHAALAAAREGERQALAAAEALEQQARASAEALEKEAREQAWQKEQKARAEAEAAEAAAQAAESLARNGVRAAERRLDGARAEAQTLAAAAARVQARAQAVAAEGAAVAGEMAEAEQALAAAKAELAALADPVAAQRQFEQLRAALAAARDAAIRAAGERDAAAAAAAARSERARLVAAERASWVSRADDAACRVAELSARREQAVAVRQALAAAPERIRVRQQQAAAALAAAEAAYREAADGLVVAEGAAAAAALSAREAEAAAVAARERALRLEGAAAAAEQAAAELELRIRERLGVSAGLPDPPAEATPETEEKLRRRLERLLRERDEMGPVNLRAEIEAEELARQITAIEREGSELASAIAKLRGSIGHLNRQGRERLLAVFETVDGHFRALFARMFNGGKARLALVGDDDPLAAGLEIYAEPPGKRAAALSLLSGGEQAVAAISLIFAVFRCNPAPIAVLDEVDAPLDDANVERFCLLLEDMVRQTGTRFVVMTHHYITMARMDRLYGVTMQERGVSRVLSVDLERAAALAEA